MFRNSLNAPAEASGANRVRRVVHHGAPRRRPERAPLYVCNVLRARASVCCAEARYFDDALNAAVVMLRSRTKDGHLARSFP